MELTSLTWMDKLFSEATFESDRMRDGVYHPYIPIQFSDQPLRLSVTQDQYRKFAELIIHECVKICEQNAEDVDNGDVFRQDAQRLENYRLRFSTGSLECADLIKGLIVQQHLSQSTP
jgi:hypothetical protein